MRIELFPDNIDEAFLRSSILGFLFFVFYIYLLVSRYFMKNLFNFSIFTLVILISFVTAITRLNQGIHTAVSSRYRLLSVLFLVSLFIFLIEFAKRKKLNIKLVNSVVFLLSVTYLFLFNFNYLIFASAFGGKLWILQGSRATSSPFHFYKFTALIFIHYPRLLP